MPQFDDEKQDKKIEALRRQEEEELAQILAQKYGLGYADLSNMSVNIEALQLVEEAEARDALAAPFARVGKKLSVGVKSPHLDKTQDFLKKLEERGYTLSLYMVSMQSLERAWNHYRDVTFAVETRAGLLDISSEEMQKLLAEIKTLEDAREKIDEVLGKKKAYRISSILEVVLSGALSQKASDVHIEPEEGYVRLRFRLDGLLTDIIRFDRETYGLLLSRVKLLSGLKLNIRNEGQDGRFSIRMDQKDIEIRTSVLPGAYGESIVLRLLDPSTLTIPLEDLGMDTSILPLIESELKKPNGMVLNTGPTGAGKTTTLYSFLRKVHSPDVKIITIEDPIEYHLPGIVQTQVSEDYTFAQGLRSTLRQNPNIVMVGEIRDREVAETAANFSLTGHLVFSTLHTNDAAGAFPRLIDLGVSPATITSAVNLVMAQRLVRRLRPECSREVPLEGEDKKRVDAVLQSITDKSLIPKKTDTVRIAVTEPEKCTTPYTGRIGVFEIIRMNDEIARLIETGANAHEIKKTAIAGGMLTMEQDGILKALRGVTTLAELDRVLSIDASSQPAHALPPEDSSFKNKSPFED